LVLQFLDQSGQLHFEFGGNRAAARVDVELAAAVLIIHLSPENGPTAEILSRTRPTLLDFLVAICAGPAVGYAVIRGQNSVFTGVAIAQGAALLLLANVAGLAAGIGAVAVWYGMYATRLLPLKMLAVTAMPVVVAIPLVLPQ
jgi:uncharacterized membrane protein